VKNLVPSNISEESLSKKFEIGQEKEIERKIEIIRREIIRMIEKIKEIEIEIEKKREIKIEKIRRKTKKKMKRKKKEAEKVNQMID